MSNKSILLTGATGLVALLLLAGCKSGGSGASSGAGSTAAAAPETTLTMPGLDGMDATVAQYKGKVVLVNFWATWCAPCKEEIPLLMESSEKYGPKGFVILGVAMDTEGKKIVEPWVKTQRFTVNGQPEPMNYKILLGDDNIADKFGGLIGMPTSMLYSRDGKRVRTFIGEIKPEELPKAIEGQL